MRYALILALLVLTGCSMSRADRIEIGCSALLAVAEPLGAVCVHDMSDDDLLSLASALERVDGRRGPAS